MNLNVENKNAIPFTTISALNRFEQQLFEAIKQMLNQSFAHIKVNMSLSLGPWCGGPVIINDNATFDLQGSKELVKRVTNYVSTRDDIEPLLQQYTLTINLEMGKKEMAKKELSKTETAKPQQTDNLPTFTPTEPRYRFDQMILPDHIKQDVLDAIKIIEHKDLIYNEWGFSEVDPIPRSILNFYGEAGTGKTMCAHAVAHYLGKKILALNYSEIESKYVGEAPKNLQHAFATAKECDAVLFFDEADSFLGKRIENVTQGAEQALNSLRSQMLILLEEFPGVVLFATNLVTNFDHAFESRILKHIQFELPNQEARAAIIKKMLPSRLPLEIPFTQEQLMEASEIIDGFSGREIKGAILELLLTKAGTERPVITFQDLCDEFHKKFEEKKELKAQEERRIKEKIEKKLKEKAAENRALKEQEESEEQENQEKTENTDSEMDTANEPNTV